ncbi:hypothetical protein ACQU0X_26540 [Pseudovibrio ascidiaceicola]|uniref:hypothetical protein n=1 Tax=Pseudovibrio ascidiaceicola TaxID=285279 RepID=UPI003D35B357
MSEQIDKVPLKVLMANIRKETRARIDNAKTLSRTTKFVKFFHKTDPSRLALAQQDMSRTSGYRCTFFDEKGPVSHMEFDHYWQAIDCALQSHFEPQEAPSPALAPHQESEISSDFER